MDQMHQMGTDQAKRFEAAQDFERIVQMGTRKMNTEKVSFETKALPIRDGNDIEMDFKNVVTLKKSRSEFAESELIVYLDDHIDELTIEEMRAILFTNVNIDGIGKNMSKVTIDQFRRDAKRYSAILEPILIHYYRPMVVKAVEAGAKFIRFGTYGKFVDHPIKGITEPLSVVNLITARFEKLGPAEVSYFIDMGKYTQIQADLIFNNGETQYTLEYIHKVALLNSVREISVDLPVFKFIF